MNAFVPVRPIAETSSGYQNYLNWLSNAGAFSNLADSMIYRHIPDPKISIGYPQEPSYAPNMRAGNLKAALPDFMANGPQKDTLLKAEPYLKNVKVENADLNVDGSFRMNKTKPSALVAINPIQSVGSQETTLRHEGFGHAAQQIRPEYQERKRIGGSRPDFFDNSTKQIISHDEYMTGPKSEEYYYRSTPEIMSESNMANDKTLATRQASSIEPAVAPNKQIHPIYKNFMQNLSKLGRVTSKAIPAITTPAQVVQTGGLYDNVKQLGPSAGYAKWLGLETYDPAKDPI